MPVRRDKRNGVWRYRKVVELADGRKVRIQGRPVVNTKVAAEAAERAHIERVLNPSKEPQKKDRKEAPTFSEWWEGRFWEERVVGAENKPSERQAKECIYRRYLKRRFGKLQLDTLTSNGHIARFRAELIREVEQGRLSRKRVNNLLTPLSTALRYAADQGVIDRAPKVGLLKVEPPEIIWWEFQEYSRLLAAARDESEIWFAAVCLAGEAGLRVGEVRALVWERDIDLVGGTLTVNRQVRQGVEGSPKGKTRRTVPMTTTLVGALRELSVVRRGFVVRNSDGSGLRDGQTTHAIYRICRKAGLPERSWHSLRHTFGTHAAMFGANPWKLMVWLGHKQITETFRYVHVAGDHQRPIPTEVLEAGRQEDPDRRVICMLGARFSWQPGGNRKMRERQLGVI